MKASNHLYWYTSKPLEDTRVSSWSLKHIERSILKLYWCYYAREHQSFCRSFDDAGFAFPSQFQQSLDLGSFLLNSTTTSFEKVRATCNSKDDNAVFRIDSREPRNLNLAFLGDSLCRHMYYSLVYYLFTGHYLENQPTPNFHEGGFPTRKEYRAFVAATLNYTEACDCFTPEGPFIPWGRMHRIWANNYFPQPERNNYITHITKAGSFEAHGHWNASQIMSNATYRDMVRKTEYPPAFFACRGNWQETIREHLSKLIPKPRYVVLNAGLWPHDLLENYTLPAIRRALNEHDMIGIYKTTTKKLKGQFHILGAT